MRAHDLAWRRMVRAGLVLGIGLGGFVDGIVLHQILQWHNMLSAVTPPTTLVAMKYNMVWDGLFHAAMWIACVAGVGLLFHAGRDNRAWSGRLLAGSMLAGWGAFNFVEGIVDHLVLRVHHVHPGENELAWDLGFVAIGGLCLIAVGVAIARKAMPAGLRSA